MPFYGKSDAQSHREYGPKTLCICADDFGLHEGINQAVLELGTLGHISAVSCMVDGPAWQQGSSLLRQTEHGIQVGLHLNFTEMLGHDIYHCSLSRLIALAYAQLLDRRMVRENIQRQLALYQDTMGRDPEFVDGHQHVHQLPVIRDMLIEVLDGQNFTILPWIRSTMTVATLRSCAPSLSAWLKSRLLSMLGARALSRLATRHGYLQNESLLGVYGFDADEARYLDYLDKWLACAASGDLLMCHPSIAGKWHDPILDARVNEYRALKSISFATLTTRHAAAIGPLG
jgi:predicted glycoside hydrolase/deacetylase ChbG (UPF0249 family)